MCNTSAKMSVKKNKQKKPHKHINFRDLHKVQQEQIPCGLLNNSNVLICSQFVTSWPNNFENTFRDFPFGEHSHLKMNSIASICMHIS